MNILQLKLSKVIKMIDDEVRIDDDFSGGYLEEPFDNIIQSLYEIQEIVDNFNYKDIDETAQSLGYTDKEHLLLNKDSLSSLEKRAINLLCEFNNVELLF